MCCVFVWPVAALASLGYEKTCVLFNAAALASQIAAEQNLDNDEGLKAAAKYYQVGKQPRARARPPIEHLVNIPLDCCSSVVEKHSHGLAAS